MLPESLRTAIPQVLSVQLNLVVRLPYQRLVIRKNTSVRQERRDHVDKVRPELHLGHAMRDGTVARPGDLVQKVIQLVLRRSREIHAIPRPLASPIR